MKKIYLIGTSIFVGVFLYTAIQLVVTGNLMDTWKTLYTTLMGSGYTLLLSSLHPNNKRFFYVIHTLGAVGILCLLAGVYRTSIIDEMFPITVGLFFLLMGFTAIKSINYQHAWWARILAVMVIGINLCLAIALNCSRSVTEALFNSSITTVLFLVSMGSYVFIRLFKTDDKNIHQ